MESRIKNISIALIQTQGLVLHIPQIKGSSEKAICTAEIRFNALMKLKFVTRSGRRTIELYDAVSLEVSSLQFRVWYTRAALLLSRLQPPGGERKTSFVTNFKQ